VTWRGIAALPHRRAASLAVPAIAAHVAVPLAGLVDTAVLGQFSSTVDLAAVGLGSAVIVAVYWAFSFLRPGTTALVGQSWGRQRTGEAVRHLQRALGLALAIGAVWLAVQWWVLPLLVRLLAADSGAGVVADGYTLIRGLSLPAVLITAAIVGYFIGAQNTRVPLVIAATVSGFNIVLDFIFIAGAGWGAEGAAWATFAAEYIGAIVAAFTLWRFLDARQRARLRDWRHRSLRTGWGRLTRMNTALSIRTALLMGALTFVAAYGARFGDDVLAANTIILQMMYVASFALDGYATAAEAMAARESGTGDIHAFHRAAAASSVAGMALAVVFTVVIGVGREGILALLTDLPEVLEQARVYWWAATLLPIISAPAWLLDGIFLGAARTRDMLVSMAFSVVCVFVPLVWGAYMWGVFTNAWLWAAFLMMNVARALTLAGRYVWITRRGTWHMDNARS